ncbi:MAG TPA: DNA polymerase III subunit gamma/tau [Solirubrobacteraceae bacterium]|nr:DNA polymerase III subunit gamma/tau [Solirubrobacteraceae bacterium]
MSAEELSQPGQSLYRRHRPRTFTEVVGQEPVVRTLRNAVERDKVHHAYLFVGSRGTGKTSMAKILAASLNCAEGPTTEPCGRCESCVSIARASSLDVLEMDAASNNSVEDIRELRESVAYAPVSGRRKVYILDEAHMLSTAAWNAFLKTLEEPPPNTVFVLATTEAGKVPPTVVDRCHRFDFQRPTVEQIGAVLRRVADAESIRIPPEALAAIARSATGSFRNALGTLEQLVTYSGSEIALEDALAVLGVADGAFLLETIDAVARGDAAAALRALEQRAQQGNDPASLARDLEARARELLLVQALDEIPPELSLTADADTALREQAARVGHDQVLRLLELLGEAMEGIRAGADARTRLELALVKAARPELDGSLKALLSRIERLETGGAPPTAAGTAPGAPPVATSSPGPSAVAAPAAPPEVAPEPRVIEPDGEDLRSPQRVPAPSDPPGAAPATTAGAERGGTVDGGSSEGASFAGDLDSLLELWPAVVELVRGEHAMLGAVVKDARPVALDGLHLTLAFSSTAQFLRKKAEDPANRAIVGEALRSLAPGRWRLSYELRDVPGEAGGGASEELTEDELVRRFIEEFDGEEVPADWLPDGHAEQQDPDALAAGERGA